MTVTPSAAPQVIEYARPVGTAEQLDPWCHEAARRMVGLSILSGLCVAVCFAAMAWGPFGAALHVAVFAATLVVAVRAGVPLAAGGRADRRRQVLDTIAGVGLAIIGVAPLFAPAMDRNVSAGDLGALALGAAFLALAATTTRHVLLYRTLGTWAATANRTRFGKGLVALGLVKALYEGAWLACCAVPLLAVGVGVEGQFLLYPAVAALFGCFGFAPIWVWMIVAHARLASALR